MSRTKAKEISMELRKLSQESSKILDDYELTSDALSAIHNNDEGGIEAMLRLLGYHFEPAHPSDCVCYEYGTETTMDGWWKDGKFISNSDLKRLTEIDKHFYTLEKKYMEELNND